MVELTRLKVSLEHSSKGQEPIFRSCDWRVYLAVVVSSERTQTRRRANGAQKLNHLTESLYCKLMMKRCRLLQIRNNFFLKDTNQKYEKLKKGPLLAASSQSILVSGGSKK